MGREKIEPGTDFWLMTLVTSFGDCLFIESDVFFVCIYVGVRLYFMTTTPERFEDRPSKLSLVHVRMPPGCAPSSRPERPFMVHAAYYRQGNGICNL